MAKSFLSYFSGETAKLSVAEDDDEATAISQIINTQGNVPETPDQETIDFIARRNSVRLQRLLRRDT